MTARCSTSRAGHLTQMAGVHCYPCQHDQLNRRKGANVYGRQLWALVDCLLWYAQRQLTAICCSPVQQ